LSGKRGDKHLPPFWGTGIPGVPGSDELTLAINETDTHCDVEIAMQASRDYGLAGKDAERILKETRAAVSEWRQVAAELKIPQTEQDLMVDAFAD
jgi:hypothetical protein